MAVVVFSPNLTWRDMQHIVVQTAKKANLRADDWVTNGAGKQGPSTCNYNYYLSKWKKCW